MAVFYGKVLRRYCANGTIEVSLEPKSDELTHYHGVPEQLQLHHSNIRTRVKHSTIAVPDLSDFATGE